MDFLSYMDSDANNTFIAQEMDRILALPIKPEIEQSVIDSVSEALIKPSAEISELLAPQAEGLLTYIRTGGLVGFIGVGFGKTLLTVSICNHGFRKGLRKIVLMMPSNLHGKLVDHEIEWLRNQIPVNIPIYPLGGKTKKQRQSEYMSDSSGLYLVPYSLLSVKDTDEMLENISPELIVCDEAHALKNLTTSSTMRMSRYMTAKPSTEFVAVSGTLASKSVADYAHLVKWALKDNSPLPTNNSELNDWCEILDTSFDLNTAKSTLVPLIEWARTHFADQMKDVKNNIAGFRKAFSLRMTSCVGIVSSGDAEVNCSLTVENIPVEDYTSYEGYDKLQEHIDNVNELWQTPADDPITEAFHLWKWNNELSAGFYNELTWPSVESLMERRECSESQATKWLVDSKFQHEAHNMFGSALRKWIKEEGSSGLDSPLLVCNDMYNHGPINVGGQLYGLWQRQRDLVFDDIVVRDSKAVRVCSYKVDASVRWAKKKKKGIIWVYHKAMLKWVLEECEAAGLNPLACPSGSLGDERIQNPKNWNRLIVASITGHSTGKNLQYIQNHYICQWPRVATTAEQLLGRTHRTGVEKLTDCVTFNTCLSTPWDHQNFAATLVDSCFIHEGHNKQKLMYCDLLPKPKIFPAAILNARGMQVKADSKTINKLTNRWK